MSVSYSRAAEKISRRASWYPALPASLPHISTPSSVMNLWGLLVLVILIFIAAQVSIQAVLYLWSKFRQTLTTSDDTLVDNSSTDSGPDTCPYLNDIGPDVPTTTDAVSSPHEIQPRPNDDPYVAGVTSLISLEDAEMFRPAPLPVANDEEVRRLIVQLHSIINEAEGEDDTKRDRLDAVQNKIARLVMADPRYAVVSPVAPLGPPPAYSDAIAV